MISIIIADDHTIVRKGIRFLLENESDFKIVAEASNGIEALDMAERYKPDIMVLDVAMDGMNGIEVARQMRKRSAGTKVVMLSMYADEAYVVEALKARAHGYVLKEASSEELVRAVRDAFSDGYYLSNSLSQRSGIAILRKIVAVRKPD